MKNINEEFVNMAIDASDKYYTFLDETNRGIARINATYQKSASDGDMLSLKLSRRIFDIDCIGLEIFEQEIEPADFKVLNYDDKQNIMQLRLKCKDAQSYITQLNEKKNAHGDIMVISDLKFLVKRVQTWFEDYGDDIMFPDKPKKHDNLDYLSKMNLSDEQKQAVDHVLSNPFSYVWGGPGTGKTQKVLAASVLHYILKGERVLICAPTNNAVEQMLHGLVPALHDFGISDSQMFRLGTPSHAFGLEFPDICEQIGSAKRIKEINAALKNVDKLDEMERLEEYISFIKEEIIPRLKDDTPASRKEAKELAESDPELKKLLGKLTSKNCKVCLMRVRALLAQKSVEQEIESRKIGEFAKWTPDVLFEYVTSLKEEKEKLENSNAKNRMEQAQVLACTVDGYIARIKPSGASIEGDTKRKNRMDNEAEIDEKSTLPNYDFNAAHVFIDESAYLSLIKAATLLGMDAPLTLLGDHMQLPPVCEMQDSAFNQSENENVFMWAQSAIHLEEIFADDRAVLRRNYINATPPTFNLLKKVDLTTSFRFGNRLSDILNYCVYKNGFKSAVGETNFKIVVIDSPKQATDDKRTNANEASGVVSYVKQNHLTDYAILTPYRKQVGAISGLMSYYERENVMTVHSSQGREFGTVLLSVCDTFGDKWFTDSCNGRSGGLNILNTAISRAKDCLVIAIDCKSWDNTSPQFLSKMISQKQ
ncbi:MAG: AAA family ATPase [Clostridiales bacterium]|jgi:hypothetical protein|nr:AAA family ATPase [Clostridiales bacterium]